MYDPLNMESKTTTNTKTVGSLEITYPIKKTKIQLN